MKRGDIILIVTLCILAIGGILLFSSLSKPGNQARITVDGAKLGDYSLNQNRTIPYEHPSRGTNRIVIKDGAVSIDQANCPDLLCVRHKPISHIGESIICLPHRLVVEIIGSGTSEEPDAIVR